MTSTRWRFVLVAILVVACAAAACGGGTSVTGPSTVGGSSVSAGATINGVVNGGSGLKQTALVTADKEGAGLTVSIAGTQISVPVGSSGNFTLNNVPAGPIQLMISGSGINATVSLTVSAQETVQLAITVSGNSAKIDSEKHSRPDLTEREGSVTGLTGACPTLTFTVGAAGSATTTKVTTDGNTQFEDVRCTNIQNGAILEVKGKMQTNGSLLAVKVEPADNDRDDGDDEDD